MRQMVKPVSSLNDCLMHLTKEELHDIRRALDVKNASALNKRDLIACLAKEIVAKLETTLRYFDMKRYQYIQLVIDSGGTLAFEEMMQLDDFDPFHFRTYGLMFIDPVSRDVMIPFEVAEQLKTLDQVWLRTMLKRNTEWIQLSMGMLYYYGTLNFHTLVELMGRYIDEPDFFELLSLISRYAEYDEGCYFSREGVSYYTVLDPKTVADEHESRPEVDYYPFSRQDLLQAADGDYIEHTKTYRELERFLRQTWRLDGEETEVILLDLHDHIQNGAQLSGLIDFLQSELEFISIQQIQGLSDRLVRWMNGMRLWFLKGYSPDQLRDQLSASSDSMPHPIVTKDVRAEIYDFSTKKKIGRNDPCPCGSGKKFKKCCGS